MPVTAAAVPVPHPDIKEASDQEGASIQSYVRVYGKKTVDRIGGDDPGRSQVEFAQRLGVRNDHQARLRAEDPQGIAKG